MIQESQVSTVLVHTSTLHNARSLSSRPRTVFNVTRSSLIKKRTDRTTPSVGSGKSRAAILFTSGTSGTPKGVYLLNEALSNTIESISRACEVGHSSRILQQSAMSFNLSIFQTLMALANGACLVIATSEERASPNAIVDLLASHHVSITFAAPSEYQWWVQSCGPQRFEDIPLRTIITGGEKVKQSHLATFKSIKNSSLRYMDGYGPTEATIFSNIGVIDYTKQNRWITVGSALHDTAIYVVDEELRSVALGMSGEIYIGGVGVNGGYLSAEMTKERFLPNIFAGPGFLSNGWSNMYRTGDKGRLLSDGTLLIEGRIAGDTQIKLRGVRM
ncbi:AMP-dependent synthetase and ligase, partial [Periconia macrospinosa]